MSTLIITVLLGIAFAFFATQNTNGVGIHFAQYSLDNVPLYMLILGSLLVGLVLSWVISLIDGISSAITLRGKDARLKETNRNLEELQAKLHDLEIENSHLRGEVKEPVVVEKRVEESTEEHSHNGGFMEKLRHSFS